MFHYDYIIGKNFQKTEVVEHKVWYSIGCKVVETLAEAQTECFYLDFDFEMITPVTVAIGRDSSYQVLS